MNRSWLGVDWSGPLDAEPIWWTPYPVRLTCDGRWVVELPDGPMFCPRHYRPATVAEMTAVEVPRGQTSCCPYRSPEERAISDAWVEIVPWPALPPLYEPPWMTP